jgi:hypothetical protein
MGNYNPHAPQILGQEFVPIRNEDLTFSPSVNSVEMGTSYTQPDTQTIRTARFYLHEQPESIAFYQVGAFNLYPNGQEEETGPIRQVIIPCTAAIVSGAGTSLVGASTIAEALAAPDDFKFVNIVYDGSAVGPTANSQFLRMWFGVSQYPILNGKRILNVSLLYAGSVQDTREVGGFTSAATDFIHPFPCNSTLTLVSQVNDASVGQGFTPPFFCANTGTLSKLNSLVPTLGSSNFFAATVESLDLGDVNNCWNLADLAGLEKLPWRYADLLRFEASAGLNRQSILVQTVIPKTSGGINGAGTAVTVNYLYFALRVQYCEETRVAVGGQQYQYGIGMNPITARTLAQAADPVIPAGVYTPTLSWVSMGQVGLGAGLNGTFPKLNATRELYQLPSHEGVKVNVPFPVEDHLGDTFTRERTHILPQISLHNTAGEPLTSPHVYGRQAAAQVYNGVDASQKISSLPLSDGGMRLNGAAGTYASTPDNAVFDITTNIALVAEVTLADWTPSVAMVLISKWNPPNNLSYLFYIDTTGLLNLTWTTGGTIATVVNFTSTVPVPISSGRIAVGVGLDVDNGAAGKTAQFSIAPSINGPWTQLGASVTTAGVTSIFSGNAVVEIGTHTAGGSNPLNGIVHAAAIGPGNPGTADLNNTTFWAGYPRFNRQTAGTTSFTDDIGRVWTLNGSAFIEQSDNVSSPTYPQVRWYARRFGDTAIPLTLDSAFFSAGLRTFGLAAHASTPDTAVLDITGNIDLRADIALYQYVGGPATQVLISKFDTGGQLAYRLALTCSPTVCLIQFAWQQGGGVLATNSTVSVPVPPSGRITVRSTMVANNGSGNSVHTFYTGSSVNGPWTQLGSTVLAGVTSIDSTTSGLYVGNNGNAAQIGEEPAFGVIFAAQVRNGVDGTIVANPNFAAQAPNTSSFADSAGRTWTVATNFAQIIGSSSVTLTPAEFDALPELTDGWKEINKRFSNPPTYSVGVLSGFWRWSAAIEAAGNRWEVLGAVAPAIQGVTGNTLAQVPLAQRLGAATYGAPTAGTLVDFDWLPGESPIVTAPAEDPSADGVLIFSLDAPAVSGFSVTTRTQSLTTYADCASSPTCCAPTALLYNRLTWTMPTPTGYLDLPGRGGAYATTPDANVLDITGDVDLRADLANWRPIAAYQILVGKWSGVTGISYRLAISPVGFLQIAWSVDGINVAGGVESTMPVVPDPTTGRIAVRATLDVDNGAAGNTCTFYTAPTISGTWTQLGPAIVNAGVMSIASTSTIVEVGTAGTGEPLRGSVYAVEIRNGINGTVVANPNFAAQPTGTTSFTDGTGLVWSMVDGAQIVNNQYQLELQRLDSLSDWKTIMLATSPVVTGFNDYEARISLTSSYRIRMNNVLNFSGPWSSTITTTLPTPGVSGGACLQAGHVMIFTTNERQDGSSNLAYSNSFEGQVVEDFSFPEAGFTQFQALYNRDFFTAFRPTERGGEQFTRTILVSAAAIPPETLADFVDLRDMAWDTVPYICVRDEDGNRWFANVGVPSGNVRNNRKLYQAVVNVVEVTDTPSEVDP